MATNKPKVCGYIPANIHTQFKEFRTENNFSDSQALVFILESFFGSSTSGKPLGGTPVIHQDVTGRIDKLEEKLTLLMDMYTPIYSKLFPSKPPSDIPVEHQGIIADLLGSDAPSSLPVEHQEPQEHEDSKPPSDTPDGTLQEPQGEEDDKLPSDTPVDHQEDISDTPQEESKPLGSTSVEHQEEHFHRNYRIIRELLQCQYFLNEGAKHGYTKDDLNQNEIRENIKTHKEELEELLGIEIKLKATTEILFNQIIRAMGADVVGLGKGRYKITTPDQLL
jgi:hypothetical protein